MYTNGRTHPRVPPRSPRRYNNSFKSKVIISSQDVKDITPKSLKQIQTFLLFPNLDEDRLSFVYTKAAFPIDEPTFIKM